MRLGTDLPGAHQQERGHRGEEWEGGPVKAAARNPRGGVASAALGSPLKGGRKGFLNAIFSLVWTLRAGREAFTWGGGRGR